MSSLIFVFFFSLSHYKEIFLFRGRQGNPFSAFSHIPKRQPLNTHRRHAGADYIEYLPRTGRMGLSHVRSNQARAHTPTILSNSFLHFPFSLNSHLSLPPTFSLINNRFSCISLVPTGNCLEKEGKEEKAWQFHAFHWDCQRRHVCLFTTMHCTHFCLFSFPMQAGFIVMDKT